MSERGGESGRAAPPTEPGQVGPAPAEKSGAMEDYHRVAETVGFVPSLRVKDNLFQMVFVLSGIGVGVLLGWLGARGQSPRLGSGVSPAIAMTIGGVLGFIVAGVVSGLILMVVGWVRALRGRGD